MGWKQVMLAEFKQLKEEFPDRILIASIMEEYNRSAWEELIGRCEEVRALQFWRAVKSLAHIVFI